jgi:hypothetical protein
MSTTPTLGGWHRSRSAAVEWVDAVQLQKIGEPLGFRASSAAGEEWLYLFDQELGDGYVSTHFHLSLLVDALHHPIWAEEGCHSYGLGKYPSCAWLGTRAVPAAL